jgi:hypothetical protein
MIDTLQSIGQVILIASIIWFIFGEIIKYYRRRCSALIEYHFTQVILVGRLIELGRRIGAIDGKPETSNEEDWLEEIDREMEKRGCPCFRCDARRFKKKEYRA